MIPGIHISTSGGIQKAPARLRELGLAAGQLFTANQRRWAVPEIPRERVERFIAGSSGLTFVSHASYLINPASSREDVRIRSEIALTEEIARCRLLRIPYLVIHPGSHQDAGIGKGMKMVASALARAVSDAEDSPMILLENTAGAGTSIGSRFEELAEIRELTGISEKMGFCIDTAHAHGAGYEVGEAGFTEELCTVLGGDNIRVFHMNGSKVERGSLRDRHEHYTKGLIGLSKMKSLFSDPVFEHVLGIAETPGTDEERLADIQLLAR